MSRAPELGDYVEVSERIIEFRAKHPTGSLQPADPSKPYSIERVGDQAFVVVVAAAYRTPDDPRPGIGTAWEPCPGRTPYTRFSELQNAETSAWGRAIIAVGAADAKRGVASADEIRNRPAERQRTTRKPPEPAPPEQPDEPRMISDPQLRKLMVMLGQADIKDRAERLAYCSEIAGRQLESSKSLTSAEAKLIIDTLAQASAEPRTGEPA